MQAILVTVLAATATVDVVAHQQQAVPLRRTCQTCKGPAHSWATVPVSFHGSRLNTDHGASGLELSAADLAAIARFPLITLEKWQGVNASRTGVPLFAWEEDAWIVAARQIKRANPAASVVVWMDTMLIYTGWNWPDTAGVGTNHTLNPDATEPCSAGHFRSAEFLETEGRSFLLKNRSGLPALYSPYGNCHVYDHSQSRVRQYWTEMCLNLTDSGVIDGCGADFSGVGVNSWNDSEALQNELVLDRATAVAWTAGHRQMMRETTAALGDGLLVGKDAEELGDGGHNSDYHVNAVLDECCYAHNDTVNRLRNLTATSRRLNRRLVYQCHYATPVLRLLAAFLIGAGDDHYFTVGGWGGGEQGFPDHWSALFDKPLGRPLADALYGLAPLGSGPAALRAARM